MVPISYYCSPKYIEIKTIHVPINTAPCQYMILVGILLSVWWHIFLKLHFSFSTLCACAMCMCVSYFCMCIGAPVSRCTCTCVPVHMVTQSWCWGSSSMLFHLIYWARVSQSNPELVHMSILASQLALGIPYSCLLGLELQASHHTQLAFMWVLGIQLLVLPFACQTHLLSLQLCILKITTKFNHYIYF